MTSHVDTRLLVRHFYPVWANERMRASDVDRNGHVHNSVYLDFLETGRFALLRDHARLPMDITGIVARVTLNYLSDLKYPGSVDIGSTVLRVGRSSLTLAQGIFFQHECIAVTETVLAFFDRTKGEKWLIQGREGEALAHFVQVRGDVAAAEAKA